MNYNLLKLLLNNLEITKFLSVIFNTLCSAHCFECAKSLPMKSNAECLKRFPYRHPATLFNFNFVSQQADTCYERET